MSSKIIYTFVFVYSLIVLTTSQSQNITRTVNLSPVSRPRAPVFQQRRSDGQRITFVQLRGQPTQGRRRELNPQNLARTTGRIPRARSFQASLPNMVPTRMDARSAAMLRGMPARNQRTSSVNVGSRSTSRNILSSVCAPPRSVRCFSWPRNRDTRSAYMCDGGCRSRTCPIPCECSCVDPRLLGRLRAVGRISGPELTLIDTRLSETVRRQLLRNRILAMRASRQRGAQRQRGANTDSGVRTNEQRRLNFGISDDVLATLIAQPLLNEIVGPQGINQILAGEPPPLLSREQNRRSGSLSTAVPTNTVRQPDIRVIETPLTRSQQRAAEISTQNQNIGIPVPLSRLNFDLITEVDPAARNMRVITSDIRPLRNATSGLNIDLPNPMAVDLGQPVIENAVSVRQLPGTNVLFVDLARSSPNSQGSNPVIRSMPAQIETVNERRRNMPNFVNNITSTDIRSKTTNNQTFPGSIVTEFGGNLQTFLEGAVRTTDPRVRPPTKDECLAQRMELWCDPQKLWDGTPGLSRWCLLNCRADNCDNQRCACACIEEMLFKTKFEQLTLRGP